MNMPYVIFKAGDNEYKLKLTAFSSVWLEKKTGCSVYAAFKRMSEVNVAALFLQASLMRFMPDVTEEEVFGIYDGFTDAGGTLGEFAEIMTEVMAASGFIKRETAR